MGYKRHVTALDEWFADGCQWTLFQRGDDVCLAGGYGGVTERLRALKSRILQLRRAEPTAATERARIRRELELWLDGQEDLGGDLEDRFLAALDRIVPDGKG